VTEEINDEERHLLEMYSKETYCMKQVPSQARNSLVAKGFLKWVPSTGWNSESEYALTPTGRKWREDRGWR